MKEEKTMREKEYCYKAFLNDSYILYIAKLFGRYYVMVTDNEHKHNYSVYGGYSRIGDAANRIKESASSYYSNSISYYYKSKKLIDRDSAFSENIGGNK